MSFRRNEEILEQNEAKIGIYGQAVYESKICNKVIFSSIRTYGQIV